MKTLHGLPPVTGSGTARRAATAIYLSRSRSQHAASLDVSFFVDLESFGTGRKSVEKDIQIYFGTLNLEYILHMIFK